MSYQVLRGGWIESDLSGIRKGEAFRVSLDRPADPRVDNNPVGDDIYIAKSNAYQKDGKWMIDIEKPNQARWATDYLNKLKDLGVDIQVKGFELRDVAVYKTLTG